MTTHAAVEVSRNTINMTTLVPRKPYTQEELKALYPSELELQLVQVLLRHGLSSKGALLGRQVGMQDG